MRIGGAVGCQLDWLDGARRGGEIDENAVTIAGGPLERLAAQLPLGDLAWGDTRYGERYSTGKDEESRCADAWAISLAKVSGVFSAKAVYAMHFPFIVS